MSNVVDEVRALREELGGMLPSTRAPLSSPSSPSSSASSVKVGAAVVMIAAAFTALFVAAKKGSGKTTEDDPLFQPLARRGR